MRIDEIHKASGAQNRQKLRDIAKYAHTLDFRRKLDRSLYTLDSFFSVVEHPVISCGGGKDGTAIALLAKAIGAQVPYITANPPNPLPDRSEHNKNLRQWLGGDWHIVPYDWDVQSVLRGDTPYPDGLKMKALSQYQMEHHFDGVVFGCRAAESSNRKINLRMRGEIYRLDDGTMRCQPIAYWNAEDSLCLAMLFDAPVNPVYIKMDGIGDMEQLHDGTWWPHGMQNRAGWMKKYYPDYFDLYEQAIRVGGCSDAQCRY